jgi:hypothetical protein
MDANKSRVINNFRDPGLLETHEGNETSTAVRTAAIAETLAIAGTPELEFLKKSMGARHRVGIGLSYRPAMLHRLAELMPWHRFLGSIKV